jgi:hypothetical protein
MISVDLQTAAALFSLGIVILFLSARGLSRPARKSRVDWDSADQVECCSYCGYVFLHCLQRQELQCPRCQSFLEKPNDRKTAEE